MSAEKALTVLQEIVAQRLRWGRQTQPPHTVTQIMEALELVSAAGWLGKPKFTEADVVLLRRQLGAAKSRLKKHLGTTNVTEDDVEES
jgi:hypothetical protein